MLPEARRRSLLNHLARAGSDTIINLSARFHVSTMTIRRDLKTLQKAGYVTLTHGGAIYDGDTFQLSEAHHVERATIQAAKKRAIGRYVAEVFVDDGDVLFLDSGTTVRAMVPFLKNRGDLTAASNSTRTLEALYRHLPDSAILCTGGLLGAGAQSFVGPVAERFFEDFFARKAFISGVGFTSHSGLGDSLLLDTAVKKAMIRSAEATIVMIDSSKIGHTAMVQVLATSAVQTLVTDDGISDEQRACLLEHDIDLHTVGAYADS